MAGILLISACKEEEPVTPASTIDPSRKGNLMLEFDGRVNGLKLILNSQTYLNALNQEFTISRFDYYISNIVLVNENGNNYTVPKDSSFFLIKTSDPSSTLITLRNIPEGNYTAVNFTIGIDSLTNTLPVEQRTGVLDPTGAGAGMYWSWNSGYIHVKMEGNSPSAPLDTVSGNNPLTFHIGGFGGYSSATINNVKTVSLGFKSDKAEVRAAHGAEGPQVHLTADAGKMFTGTTDIDFSTNAFVMFSPFSVTIANNYANMFKVEHVHNHQH